MKTAQELYNDIKRGGIRGKDAEEYAEGLAYEHTFGKGYNPEVMEELYHIVVTAVVLQYFSKDSILGKHAVSILEKAKLK